MTGFGAASRAEAGLLVRVEARSVNHRGLQVKARLSNGFGGLEAEVEAAVRKRVARGVITVQVSIERAAGGECSGLDKAAAARWAEELRALALDLGLDSHVTLDLLVGLPGVITDGAKKDGVITDVERAAVLPAAEEGAAVLATVDDALVSLAEMRAREGSALGRDLLENAREVEALVGLIRARMPDVVRDHQRNLSARLTELVGEAVPASDLAREAALIADRMDVDEELTRLASHLHQLRTLIAAGGEVGRKLDFLAQEFFREANTTGAKCNDAAVAHLVVDLKTHIERLREQVQNVE